MNSKQIIRALNALFQLDDEDRGMVLKLWNLSDSDREAFVQALQPQSQGKRTAKKSSKSSASKSPRASSLQQQIQSTRTTTSKPVLCTYELNGKVCHGAEDDGIHDPVMGYAGYHEFQPAEQAASVSGD